VGGSYRQLLGTAEMILQMRDDIGHVEDKLGRVGKGCGRGVIGGMAGGLSKLQGQMKEGKRGEEMGRAAKMKVLEMSGIVVGRLLRMGVNKDTEASKEGKGRNLVIAAKVLVLRRLLAKSLGDAVSGASRKEQDLIEELKRKLERKLGRAIERTLERIDGDEGREDLIQALCAYSLATSSGAKDVLMHFLRVRYQAMALTFEGESNSERAAPGVLRALELYAKTLLDVQALVPRRLAEALAGLKSKPLLKDETIRSLEGLSLDVCERWLGDQILFFTPYVRHDDLAGPQAVEILKSWAKDASGVLLKGFKNILERVHDFKIVVDLRTKTLDVWIKDGAKVKGFDPSIILDELRGVTNDRMVRLLESRVSKLHLVGTEIEATLGAWRQGFTDRNSNLWDEDVLAMEISNGAGLFKQGILSRIHGRNDAVSRAVRCYQTWRHLVDEISNVLDQLKKQRWDDDLEDIEDDLSIESRNNLLSKEDPQMLQDHLDKSLEDAFSSLHEKLSMLLDAHTDSDQTGKISVYFLRILREIRIELPENASLQNFGLALVPRLHERLALVVSSEAVESFKESFKKKKLSGRALWEGEPELPVQPTPWTFRLLRDLSTAMSELGSDLWTPAAVRVLKRHLRSEMGDHWQATLKASEKSDSSDTNGSKINATTRNGNSSHEKPNRDSSIGNVNGDQHESQNKNWHEDIEPVEPIELENRRGILIQSLFDVIVLQASLETKPLHGDELQAAGKVIESQIELEPSSKKRLDQSAKEFWKRVNLLFGLLA
jgi:hypothetical protein